MLYSGASLIRANGQQQERFDNLRVTEPVRPVEAAKQKEESGLNEDTRGALLRLARFLNKEKQETPKKAVPPKPASNPVQKYEQAWAVLDKFETNGQILDVYA